MSSLARKVVVRSLSTETPDPDRFVGIVRPYAQADVDRLRGSVVNRRRRPSWRIGSGNLPHRAVWRLWRAYRNQAADGARGPYIRAAGARSRRRQLAGRGARTRAFTRSTCAAVVKKINAAPPAPTGQSGRGAR
jgi:hypothetical protein